MGGLCARGVSRGSHAGRRVARSADQALSRCRNDPALCDDRPRALVGLLSRCSTRTRCRGRDRSARRFMFPLGAGASCGEAGFPSPRRIRGKAGCNSASIVCCEEPALRAPLAGRRVGIARAPGVGDERSRALARCAGGARRLRAHRGVRPAARPARRQAGQHGRVAGLQRSGARHPGIQPVRRGAPADAPR